MPPRTLNCRGRMSTPVTRSCGIRLRCFFLDSRYLRGTGQLFDEALPARPAAVGDRLTILIGDPQNSLIVAVAQHKRDDAFAIIDDVGNACAIRDAPVDYKGRETAL